MWDIISYREFGIEENSPLNRETVRRAYQPRADLGGAQKEQSSESCSLRLEHQRVENVSKCRCDYETDSGQLPQDKVSENFEESLHLHMKPASRLVMSEITSGETSR